MALKGSSNNRCLYGLNQPHILNPHIFIIHRQLCRILVDILETDNKVINRFSNPHCKSFMKLQRHLQ